MREELVLSQQSWKTAYTAEFNFCRKVRKYSSPNYYTIIS